MFFFKAIDYVLDFKKIMPLGEGNDGFDYSVSEVFDLPRSELRAINETEIQGQLEN